MDGWKTAAWWSGAVTYVCIVWVFHLFSFEDLKGQTAAAWVQAVGSVLAILAAVAVAAFQHALDVDREERKVREELRRVVGVLHRCASELKSVVNAEGVDERGAVPAHLRDLSSLFLRLDLLRRALNSFVPSQMPTAELHVLLHHLLLRVDDLLTSTQEKVRKCETVRVQVVNWRSHWDSHYHMACELTERLEFQITLIDNPQASPPW